MSVKQHPDIIASHMFMNQEWDYFCTFTLYGEDNSPGDCFYYIHTFFSALLKRDKDLDFVVYICQRNAYEKPHIHGIVRSSLSARLIEKAWRKSYGLSQVKMMDNKRKKGLYDYIKVQAVGSAILKDDLFGVDDEE